MNIKFLVIPQAGGQPEEISPLLAYELNKALALLGATGVREEFLQELWVEVDGKRQSSDKFGPILNFASKMAGGSYDER